MKRDENTVLSDITNISHWVQNKCRKRLSDETLKSYQYARKARKTIDVNFPSDVQKIIFESKFEEMKTKIGAKTNTDLLEKLMDYYSVTQGYSACKVTEMKPSELGSDSGLFICLKSKLCELIQLGNDYGPLSLVSFSRTVHVAQTALRCHRKQYILTWNSSAELHNDFVINYKMVHAYLDAYSSGHLVLSHFGACMCSYVETNLS